MQQQESPQNMLPYERLDSLLKVVGMRGWFALFFFIVLGVVAIAWSIMGTIPIVVSGKCIAFDPDTSFRIRSSTSGLVEKLLVRAGDRVRKGEVLAVVGGREITSSVDGEISWINTMKGDIVESGDVLMWTHFPDVPEDLKIFVFVPLILGQKIEPGMEVLTDLDSVDVEKYGMIRGVVKHVTPYPIGASDSSVQRIPSKPMREYLISGKTPSILVIVAPLLDPSTPSRLKWTSSEGPPCVIQPGTIGTSRIAIDRVRPLSFLLPATAKEKKRCRL